ncbi:hypothetical protein D9758_007641 [Tetrapyrgos nigripes]|uniref:RTA1-domain-containing protein n=1 Tax=Tetrapyrgos nigripes TaxID=182062 RepID=A0A8H5LJW0_9AGAR|nr:hypothetical protein D9758_007641 [Tetrapyrgos nigripes]
MSNITDVPNAQFNEDGPYGYLPNFALCTTYIVLFGLTSFIHTVEAIWTRKWFFLYTALLCGLLETLGWSARLWSNINLGNDQSFTIQISTLIIGPTFLLASIFIVFGDLVKILGTQYSRLGPNLYARIFFSCDIVSLVLQGVGGGIASSATDETHRDVDQLNLGTDIILVGIGLQIAIILVFGLLAAEFLYRYKTDKPLRGRTSARGVLDGRRQLVLCAVILSTGCLFARGIYRMIELSGGWDGPVMRIEWLFGFLDSGATCASMFIWNVFHPGWLLFPDSDVDLNEKRLRQQTSSEEASQA